MRFGSPYRGVSAHAPSPGRGAPRRVVNLPTIEGRSAVRGQKISVTTDGDSCTHFVGFGRIPPIPFPHCAVRSVDGQRCASGTNRRCQKNDPFPGPETLRAFMRQTATPLRLLSRTRAGRVSGSADSGENFLNTRVQEASKVERLVANPQPKPPCSASGHAANAGIYSTSNIRLWRRSSMSRGSTTTIPPVHPTPDVGTSTAFLKFAMSAFSAFQRNYSGP